MAKKCSILIGSILILSLLLTTMLSGYNESHAPALQILTNISRFTAQNAATKPSVTNRNVTVATMYGGWMTNYAAPWSNMTVFGKRTWTIYFTNTGNSSASFTVRVVRSNIYTGGNYADWSRTINPTTLGPLAPGAGTTFTFTISNVNPVPDGAWVSYVLQVTNTTAKASARAYQDAAGTWYGRNLGFETNFRQWATGPVVFLQHPGAKYPNTNVAGSLTVIITGPILQISKSISSVTHPSGLYSGTNWAEPGAIVTYNIVVTNAGSAAANNVAIVDTIPTTYVTFINLSNTLGGWSSNWSSPYLTLSTNTFAAGAKRTFKITVRVR